MSLLEWNRVFSLAASRSRWWLIYALVTFLALGCYALLYALGFPGTPSACLSQGSCWCESPTGTWALEPYNTWSNLTVYVCGLVLVWLIGPRCEPRPRYDRDTLLAFSYALFVQASGALFFHGTLTQWSRDFDATSVLVVHGVVVSTSLVRWGVVPRRALLPAIVLSGLIALVYRGLLGLPIDPLGLASLITTLAIERRFFRGRNKPRPLRIALVALLISMVAWLLTQPGRPLCEIFPGHALWHIGMGIAVFSFGVHAARHQAQLVGSKENAPDEPGR